MELEGRMSKDKSTTDLKKKKEKRKKNWESHSFLLLYFKYSAS